MKRKENILCVFDKANLMAEAVDAVMEDYREEIEEFNYLQVEVNTDVKTSDRLMKDMKKEMFDMFRADRIPHARNRFNEINSDKKEKSKQTLHVLDLKVKTDYFDKIDNLLWSAGGFQSRRSKGWFLSRSKKNIAFIWDMKRFFKTLTRISKRRFNSE